jgi:predicted acylesterase/phospholipase RssA
VYEIGALSALEEAIEGLALTDLHIYVGVSAGAFVAACLANGITAAELARAIASDGSERGLFVPRNFFTPAAGEFRRWAARVPGLFLAGLWDYLRQPGNFSASEPVLRLARALPAGIFDSEPIGRFLAEILAAEGRTDDFRRLDKRLVVVAADLDTGEPVRFGEPGLDHVPISKAVQASSALPGLYSPVEIDGRSYVDGILRKTMHASVALEAGAGLLVAVNPIVPVDTARAVAEGVRRRGRLVDSGLTAVLAQTLRTVVRSRMEVGMKAYDTLFPDADVVLVEPRRDDYRMFFTNIFSFSERKAVCEHAYRRTREFLAERGAELAPKLARHGLRLRTELLADRGRSLWQGLDGGPERKPRLPLIARLDGALDRLEELLPVH